MERVHLLIVYTGNGKGKTTAAMGLLLRSLGQGGRCAVLQFIKPDSLETGEKRFSRKLEILWENFGEGFLWDQESEEPTRVACRRGWMRAKTLISSEAYDLVVLDEFTYVLKQGYVSMEEFSDYIEALKGKVKTPHIVITGRDAPEGLVDIADMVHEIVEIKHPWRTAQIPAQPMIEF